MSIVLKTPDGRYIDKRVKIDKEFLHQIISEIKDFRNFNWKNLSDNLEISKSSINDWMTREATIPLSIFRRLISMHPTLDYNDIKTKLVFLEPFWGQKINKFHLPVKIPKTNDCRFAEFYGILLGDGCIYSNLTGLCISGDSLYDLCYIKNYVSPLVENLFGVEPKIYISKRERAVRCVLYSKIISRYLVGLGFPKGLKKNGNSKILHVFFENKDLLKACIRGIQDTDGSVCPHKNSKIMINMSILSPTLLQSTMEALTYLKIPAGPTNKAINIYGKNKVCGYFSLIGSSNIKHILKFKNFIQKGYTPRNAEIERLLIQEKKCSIKLPYFGPVV